uniref:NADH-ubiquinone oxidoreductase chain 4L n=1 Tax=Paraglypturus tonganus (nomen nudum) TaxID=1519029 RepID=A0A0U1WNJ7_9EUCA|nr:NADH dehydrogenase subunit 4L [Paraglypturus tonganus (nomen nudum)]AIG22705.1 NADH dehydrogenase subunit 4L [Paraglypturus tonganus (nomen nudum)]
MAISIFSSMYLLTPLMGVFCGLFAFVSSRKHLLNTLLSLEFIMLNTFWFLMSCFSNMSKEIYLTLFFLTLVACEGALGLSLLVSIVRTHGNDCFKTFNSLQC